MNNIISLLDALIPLTHNDKIFWKKDENGNGSYRLLTPSFIISFSIIPLPLSKKISMEIFDENGKEICAYGNDDYDFKYVIERLGDEIQNQQKRGIDNSIEKLKKEIMQISQ